MAKRRAPPRPPPRPAPKRKPAPKPKPARKPKPVKIKPVKIKPVKIDIFKRFKDTISKLNQILTNRNIDINNLNNTIRERQRTIDEKQANINSLNTDITGLNYKIDDISNKKKFYENQLYGSNNEPGFLNIIAKKTENFSNISNTEGMTVIEGFDVSQKELDNVIKQNKLLESQIQQNLNNYTTDDTQVFYKKQQFYRQKDFNYILYIIFYLLILGLGIFLFVFDNTLNFYLKLFTIILLAIYPFIIENIEFYIYFIFYYVYAMVNGVPVNMGNYYGFTFTNK
jgi:hypothetical protein